GGPASSDRRRALADAEWCAIFFAGRVHGSPWRSIIIDMPPRIDLSATHLFGREAAEEEELAVLLSYAIERRQLAAFLEPDRQIAIARGYRGEGKSTLLRLARSRIESRSDAPLLVSTSVRQIAPSISSRDTEVWVREWKRVLLTVVARELGDRIGIAWSDDALTLVNEAEQSRFKSRSLISAVFDRINAKKVPLARTQLPTVAPEHLTQSWASRSDGIWLFVDDADENFCNTVEDKLRVASLLLAAFEIANTIPQMRLRLTVHPNTWTTLACEFEGLSKVARHCVDLGWTERELRDMLASRVRGYLVRTAQWAEFARLKTTHCEDLIALAFETPATWGRKAVSIHIPLVVLSHHRPRWLVELARIATESALKMDHTKINLADVTERLEDIGTQRIVNTVAEFSPQCAQVEDLIAAFPRQPKTYTTDELMDTITTRILPSVSPRIVGVAGDPLPVDIAAFLSHIGFLSARRTPDRKQRTRLTPGHLRTRNDRGGGMQWEIHPVFRLALKLRGGRGPRIRVRSLEAPR
ncbi:MAG TPA: hypothetical protein VK762_22885, partial [Polyangiaceae bacterium]|nr:hypothetical protein [Polyangiaceae bacterium]